VIDVITVDMLTSADTKTSSIDIEYVVSSTSDSPQTSSGGVVAGTVDGVGDSVTDGDRVIHVAVPANGRVQPRSRESAKSSDPPKPSVSFQTALCVPTDDPEAGALRLNAAECRSEPEDASTETWIGALAVYGSDRLRPAVGSGGGCGSYPGAVMAESRVSSGCGVSR
jgi:hypothetical protein